MSAALKPILRPSRTRSTSFSLDSYVTIGNSGLRTSVKSTPPNYICISCRHARLLRRPKRPYTFSQLVTLSDGSAFLMRTTNPMPVYRSTRDTRNSPLWNPRNKALANLEDDEAGRLAGFRARYGNMFDSSTTSAAVAGAVSANNTDSPPGAAAAATSPVTEQSTSTSTSPTTPLRPAQPSMVMQDVDLTRVRDMTATPSSPQAASASAPVPASTAEQETNVNDGEQDYFYEFEEDDANLLDMISSYGQASAPTAEKAKAKPADSSSAKSGKKGKK